MILPNSEYPIQVSRPQESVEELNEIISWMIQKDQDFIIAKTKMRYGKSISDRYSVFRTFDEGDDRDFLHANGNKDNFIKWTLRQLDGRKSLHDYEIIS